MTQLDELKHEAKARRRNGAVVTMAVLAVLLLGVGLFAVYPRATESVTPTPPAQTAVRPALGPLEPGRYSVLVHGDTPIRAELTLAEPGWTYTSRDELAREDPLSGMMLWKVARVYPDPCGFGSSDEGLPAGYSPEQLVTALQAQQETSVSAPTPTTVGGYRALRVDVATTSADWSGLCNLWEDAFGFDRIAASDHINPLWIVDVAGTTVVVDALAEALIPEFEAILASIQFTGM